MSIVKISVVWNEGQTKRIATGDDGLDYSKVLDYYSKKWAVDTNQPVLYNTDINRVSWSKYVDDTYGLQEFEKSSSGAKPKAVKPLPVINEVKFEDGISEERMKELTYLHKQAYSDKPELLVMSELKWKFLLRSCMRGKNIMMTGNAGCGKTMASKSAAAAMKKLRGSQFFYFNMGASQDPRSFLIGNVQFDKEKGTFFSESLFVKAIQTPNAVILLDELTRAHPEANNILMTVLDEGQRYLRIDESIDPEASTIHVAEGVTFIATANIGSEYTGTRILDRAFKDRFTTIEMDMLNAEQEKMLLSKMFPILNPKKVEAIAEVANQTREEVKRPDSKISTIISTRATVEMASLMMDGFTFTEAANVVVFPMYPADGGADSERAYVVTLVQKHNAIDAIDDIFNIKEEPKVEVIDDGTGTPVIVSSTVFPPAPKVGNIGSSGLFDDSDIAK